MRCAAVLRVLAVAVPLAITTALWLLSKTRFEAGWQVAPWQAALQPGAPPESGRGVCPSCNARRMVATARTSHPRTGANAPTATPNHPCSPWAQLRQPVIA